MDSRRPLEITKNIPYDVWLHIAPIMPRTALLALMSINSAACLDIGLNARYREVKWVQLDQVIKYLARLRDPSIACRVRHLTIDTSLMQSLSFHGKRNFGHFTTIAHYLRLPSKSSRVVRRIGTTMENMTGVTDYTFKCNPLLLGDTHPLVGDVHCLTAYAWKSFGSSLTTLTLNVGLEDFPSVLPTTDMQMHDLQTLNLCFAYHADTSTYKENGVARGNSGDILVNDIAPFINRFSFSLTSLSIISELSPDLSPFIRSLGYFPDLCHLSLSFSFDSDYLSDPSVITACLRNHAPHLTHFELRQTCHYPRASQELTPKDVSSEIIYFLYSDTRILRDLRTLSISLSPASGSFEETLSIIDRSIDTLSELCLHWFRFLGWWDICHVLYKFPDTTKLVKLELPVFRLTPGLLDLISKRLPNLEVLELVFDVLSGDISDREDSFYDELVKHSYDGWNLRDIGFWHQYRFTRTESMPLESRVERWVAVMIPTIQKIKGVPVLPKYII